MAANSPNILHLGTFKLGVWLDAAGAAINTNGGLYVISRKAIVNYVANRKGGVHFDPTRKLELKSKRKRARNIEAYLLDHGLLRIGHLSGPEFEVVSVAQIISNQHWSGELIRLSHELAPDDFNGDPRELKLWTSLEEADGTGWATSRFASREPDTSGTADGHCQQAWVRRSSQ